MFWLCIIGAFSCGLYLGIALMANGQPLDDGAFTCANWDYPFGQRLKVTNKATGNSVTVVCTDRGPAKRLYHAGRMIDLSKAAFRAIAPLAQGVCQVKVTEIQ
jgi:rare lipoprotein A